MNKCIAKPRANRKENGPVVGKIFFASNIQVVRVSMTYCIVNRWIITRLGAL